MLAELQEEKNHTQNIVDPHPKKIIIYFLGCGMGQMGDKETGWLGVGAGESRRKQDQDYSRRTSLGGLVLV